MGARHEDTLLGPGSVGGAESGRIRGRDANDDLITLDPAA
jgi:hypothetical protein